MTQQPVHDSGRDVLAVLVLLVFAFLIGLGFELAKRLEPGHVYALIGASALVGVMWARHRGAGATSLHFDGPDAHARRQVAARTTKMEAEADLAAARVAALHRQATPYVPQVGEFVEFDAFQGGRND